MPETYKPQKILLIVDDSSLIIERILIILKEACNVKKIFTATDYIEAVNILQEVKTDIVLLDIHLPGKNGIELLKYIVQHYPETRVIMLSNSISSYYRKLCMSIGAVCCIDKSTEFEMITEVIAAL